MADTVSAVEGEYTGEATPAPTPAPTRSSSFADEALRYLGRPVDTTRSDFALGQRMQAGQDYRRTLESAATRQAEDADAMGRDASLARVEREALRPGPLTLPEAPSLAARPFLDPGPNASVLQQLQSVMLGTGLIAQQIAGLKGSSVAAVSALRGAFEGWQAGDAERAKRSLAEWEAQTKKLLQEHKSRVEAYQQVVEDQKLSWTEKMGVLSLRAKADEFSQLAKATDVQDWDSILRSVQRAESLQAQQQNQFARAVISMQQHQDRQDAEARRQAEVERSNAVREAEAKVRDAEAARAHAANEARDLERLEETKRENRRRDTSDAARLGLERERVDLAKKGMAIRELNAKEAMKLVETEQRITNQLTNLDKVKEAVAFLDKEGVLAKSESEIDKAKAKTAILFKIGRGDIAAALNTVKRQGTALVAGAEMALGQTASSMRLKAIGEAELKDIALVPKAYWDQFLPTLDKNFRSQLDMTQRNLRVIDRTGQFSRPQNTDDPLEILR